MAMEWGQLVGRAYETRVSRRLRGGFEERAQLPDIVRRDVAENDVTQPFLGKGLQIEGALFSGLGAVAQIHEIFGEDEDRDLVLADLIDQVRAGNLAEVGYAATDQREVGALQFGQVERKRDLSLEPRLDRVAVG